MKPIRKYEARINKVLDAKESRLPRSIGKLGDGFGNLYSDDTRTLVWVRFGETKAIPVFCNRVAPENELQVVVGYAPEQPRLYQVLSTYSDKPGGENAGRLGGYAPATRYEWLAPKGGQDPLYVHDRALTHLNMYVTKPPSMSVQLMRGKIINASKTPIEIPAATSDHTAYIPATAGKAVLVLHTIDNTGANVETASSEFDVDLLMPVGNRFANVPAIPTDTVYVRGLVRVYNGQTAINEGRTNRDIINLAFYVGAPSGAVAWAGIVGKPGTWDALWAELTGAAAGVAAIGDLLYPRIYIKFVAPSVSDDSGDGYKIGDVWLDTIGLVAYQALDVSVGAAVWYSGGSAGGSGDLNIRMDGALAVAADVHTFLVTKDMTVDFWYIHCDDPGTASSTIFDVHKNGTTIFTTQANRPTLAWNDANGWAKSGAPDVTTFVEGDIITIDIDQIGTGAEGLNGVGQVSSSGGGSANPTFRDASSAVSVSNVGEVVIPDGMLVDNGGASVTLKAVEFILACDEKTSGTNGGTFTSGAWRTRDLNTLVSDVGSNASLATNQITLEAGVYEYEIEATAFRCNSHQARLYNITDATVVSVGSVAYADSGADGSSNSSKVFGRMVITASKAFEVQHQCSTTAADTGFGQPASFGTEVYTVARFWKVG